MLLVQIPKASDLYLWLWWLRAGSPWQWTLCFKSHSLMVCGLFLDSRLASLHPWKVSLNSAMCTYNSNAQTQAPLTRFLKTAESRALGCLGPTACLPKPIPSRVHFCPPCLLRSPPGSEQGARRPARRGNALRKGPQPLCHIRGWLHKQVA